MAPPLTVPIVTLSPEYFPLNFSPSCFSSMRRYTVVPNRSAERIQFPLRSFPGAGCWPSPRLNTVQADRVKSAIDLKRIGQSAFAGIGHAFGLDYRLATRRHG